MGTVGFPEMVAIFVIALILFGPKKLPELGRTIGKAISEFRRAKNELKNTFETHMRELERETRMEEWNSFKNYDYPPAKYSYPYEDYNGYGSASSTETSASHELNGRELNGGTGAGDNTQTAGSHEQAPEHSELPYRSEIESAPVAGTVPRNGSHPSDGSSVSDDREHSA